MRFGPDGKDYFWINDMDTVVLMHPYQPALVGKPLTAHVDSTIRRVFVDAVKRVKQSAGVFVDYQMQWQDDPTRIVPKLSYVKLYRPWGWVLGTGLYVDDVRAEIAQLTDHLLWLMMGVMVASGVLCFYVYQQATAVDKKRRRAERINRTLTAISNAVNTTFDLDELYGTIHGALGQVIDVTNFFIALYDREKDAISFPFYQDDVDYDFPEIREIDTSGSMTARVIRSAAPVLVSRREILAWAAEQGVPPVGTPAALWLGVPLKIKNTVIGVMATQSYTQSDHFDAKDLEVFVAVSEQVAVAIDRKRKEAALHRSVRRYRMLAENQSDVVVALSPSGELTYCSPAIREFGGYEPAEEIGNHIRIYFADAREMERGLKRFDVMLKNHQPGNFEMLFQPVGRDAFPVEIG
jgi:PAS domain S-box-containing protein